MKHTWRERAANVIWRIVHDHPGADERTLRVMLRESYPFGQRRYWPYKVWCEEVDRVMRRLFPRPRQVQGELFFSGATRNEERHT